MIVDVEHEGTNGGLLLFVVILGTLGRVRLAAGEHNYLMRFSVALTLASSLICSLSPSMVSVCVSACHSHLAGFNLQCVAVTLQNLKFVISTFSDPSSHHSWRFGWLQHLHLQILEHHQRHRPLLFRQLFELFELRDAL